MSWWEAIVLGIVQGLTEFLPISSSAHLAVIGQLLPSGGDPGATFTAVTQIGTESAVVLYFRRDIARIIKAWCLALLGKIPRNDQDARMGWMVILGSIPIVVLGVLFQDSIRSTFRNLYLVAAMLIIFGLLLGWADKVGQKRRAMEDLTVRHGVLYGFAQSLALIPGVSRSGGTITAGLLMGYSREAAARYSFLLAIPAVLGSGFYELLGSMGEGAGPGFALTAVATVFAFVIGYLVIIAFLKIISNYSYRPFVYYRIGIGLLIMLLCAVGWLNATPPALTSGG